MLIDEKRTELERIGASVIKRDDGGLMVEYGPINIKLNPSKSPEFITYAGIYGQGGAMELSEVLAILGIAPPGYRLVPEEEGWFLQAHTDATNDKEYLLKLLRVAEMTISLLPEEKARLRIEILRSTALASALSPKEVEKR
jgi:hypothetical protein